MCCDNFINSECCNCNRNKIIVAKDPGSKREYIWMTVKFLPGLY